MHCNKCNTEVITHREEINWCLVIILTIFTGGIGLIIYLIIYFNKPENLCVNCHSVVNIESSNQEEVKEVNNPYLILNRDVENQNQARETQEKASFCPNCGVKCERDNAKFCMYCGSNLY